MELESAQISRSRPPGEFDPIMRNQLLERVSLLCSFKTSPSWAHMTLCMVAIRTLCMRLVNHHHHMEKNQDFCPAATVAGNSRVNTGAPYDANESSVPFRSDRAEVLLLCVSAYWVESATLQVTGV